MEKEEIERVLSTELMRIAPDVDLAEIDRAGDLREELDIDSIDFLNLITALSKTLGLEIPETDYARMDSFAHLANYLEDRTS